MREIKQTNLLGLDTDDVWYYLTKTFSVNSGLVYYRLINDIWHIKGWFYFNTCVIVICDYIPVKSNKVYAWKHKRFYGT